MLSKMYANICSCKNIPRPNPTVQYGRLARLDTQAKIDAFKPVTAVEVWMGAKCFGVCTHTKNISWTDDGVTPNGNLNDIKTVQTIVAK
jgi:hypothetical protein